VSYAVHRFAGARISVHEDANEARSALVDRDLCVVKDGAVLRWAPGSTPNDQRLALTLLRKCGVLTAAAHPRDDRSAGTAAGPITRAALAVSASTEAAGAERPADNSVGGSVPARRGPKEIPVAKCSWPEEKCSEPTLGGGKYAHLCSRHRSVMYARDSLARKKAADAPPVKAAKVPPAPKPAPADDLAAHAMRCFSVVARLGGVERAERIAEVLGT
jgi:hypothetical protein